MKLRRKVNLENCSLLELCVAVSGSYLTGAKVASYVIGWGVCSDALGSEPSVEEYADWWKVSYPTAYREQARFREAFDGRLDNPAPLVAAMKAAGAQLGVRGDLRAVEPVLA